MDIQRPDRSKEKRRKRIIYGTLAVAALAGITFALSRLKPAAPTVDPAMLYSDVVKRGQMLRQVRGIGTLVPEEIRWIASRTQGRVDQILLRPGAPVTPDSIILILANPDVEQSAANADSQLKAAEAEYLNLKNQIESQVLAAEASATNARLDFQTASLRAEVNQKLFNDGLVSDLDRQLSAVTAEQAGTRSRLEEKRFEFSKGSVAPQLAIKTAEVDRLRAQARLRREEFEALKVRANMSGVLQILPVEVGAQVGPGTNLARVADPARLKAEIKIAETQVRDILIGLPAVIDTRNGTVAGKVARIDPSVQQGTVTVDVQITGDLPRGARPDLSIDGTVELERLDNVLYVSRPPFGQENSEVKIFKIDPATGYANRVSVKLGRTSVSFIEIVGGLDVGDRVIISDMSQYDENDRVKLK